MGQEWTQCRDSFDPTTCDQSNRDCQPPACAPHSYNIAAKAPDGKREGFGGGFMERDEVVQKRAFAADSDYDEYGRKKKKKAADEPSSSSGGSGHAPSGANPDEEDEEEDEEDEEDDDDEGDTSKYDLLDDDDVAEAALPMSFGGSKPRADDGAGAAVVAVDAAAAAVEADNCDDDSDAEENKQKPQSWDWGAPEKKVSLVPL